MKKIVLLLFLSAFVLTGSAQEAYKLLTDIPYTEKGEANAYRRERCKLDVYYPQGKPNFKTLVWFHGGGLEGGSKELRDEFLRKGFAVVAPNYRLYPKCKNPEYTEDAALAVAWVCRHIAEYGGDPSQVYVGGHSAGGYLALMLCLEKSYLGAYGIDADRVKGYFPVSGQCATHYTIRKERKISFTLPIVDNYAPLNHARKLGTKLILYTGDRRLEQMSRYEENLYLKSVLEGVGNKQIPIYELAGFDHGTVLLPACQLISQEINKE